VVLDPVYTGKAMAGLIDHIRKGRLTANDTVVFIHTGGLPGVFGLHHWFEWRPDATYGTDR
jgi:1-aminocyclopropane-1-carboxylate deaminase/D-cysteine desulfhydrase-like pyridoxal-dependent ACC family enzyme